MTQNQNLNLVTVKQPNGLLVKIPQELVPQWNKMLQQSKKQSKPKK